MKILLSILTLTVLISCDPIGKEHLPGNNNSIDSTSTTTLKKLPERKESIINSGHTEEQPQYFICYTSDANPNLSISISFDKDGKALKVKYKGQETSMALSFKKENYLEGGAHPTIETFYSEIYNGKENGVYKLTHSGNWDYAEYTRSKDGKKFNFTIDHELTIENDGYRTTSCY